MRIARVQRLFLTPGIGFIAISPRGREVQQMDRISRFVLLAQRDQKAKQEQHSGRADSRQNDQHSHSDLPAELCDLPPHLTQPSIHWSTPAINIE